MSDRLKWSLYFLGFAVLFALTVAHALRGPDRQAADTPPPAVLPSTTTLPCGHSLLGVASHPGFPPLYTCAQGHRFVRTQGVLAPYTGPIPTPPGGY